MTEMAMYRSFAKRFGDLYARTVNILPWNGHIYIRYKFPHDPHHTTNRQRIIDLIWTRDHRIVVEYYSYK